MTLTFLPVANPNVLYLGMVNVIDPLGERRESIFSDINVRKAIAMGGERDCGNGSCGAFRPARKVAAARPVAWLVRDVGRLGRRFFDGGQMAAPGAGGQGGVVDGE